MNDKKLLESLKSQIAVLNNQVYQVTERIRARKRKRRGTSSNGVTNNNEVSSGGVLGAKPKSRSKSSTGKSSKKKQKRSSMMEIDEKEPDEITYEQKRELSDNIETLPAEKMNQVVEIIRENINLQVIFNFEFNYDSGWS